MHDSENPYQPPAAVATKPERQNTGPDKKSIFSMLAFILISAIGIGLESGFLQLRLSLLLVPALFMFVSFWGSLSVKQTIKHNLAVRLVDAWYYSLFSSFIGLLCLLVSCLIATSILEIEFHIPRPPFNPTESKYVAVILFASTAVFASLTYFIAVFQARREPFDKKEIQNLSN
jgi:hypothetical protein